MDRQEASRALAKAVAYVECGKPELAAEWLTTLTEMFAEEGVTPTVQPVARYTLPDEPEERDPVDLSAASAWLGGRLLIEREGSWQL